MRVLTITIIRSTVLSHCSAPLGKIITTEDIKESCISHKYICSGIKYILNWTTLLCVGVKISRQEKAEPEEERVLLLWIQCHHCAVSRCKTFLAVADQGVNIVACWLEMIKQTEPFL